MMPELMFRCDEAEGGIIWIGLQGLSGNLSENTLDRGHNGLPDANSAEPEMKG